MRTNEPEILTGNEFKCEHSACHAKYSFSSYTSNLSQSSQLTTIYMYQTQFIKRHAFCNLIYTENTARSAQLRNEILASIFQLK